MRMVPAPTRVVPLLAWVFILALLLAPTLAIGVTVAVGALSGCSLDQAGPCLVSNTDLGETLKASLDAAWAVPVAFGGLWPLSLALGATVAAHWAFKGIMARVMMGGVAVALALVATVVAPVLWVFALAPVGCEINEGAVGDCLMYGTAQGMSAHSAAIAPWLLFFLGPIALGYAVVYFVVLSILAVVRARRT